MEKTKTKKKKENKLIEFFNSYQAICVALIIISIALIIYNRHVVNSIKMYNFGGANSEYIILDGTVYSGLDINRFSAPSIIYTGEYVTISNYTIGYYIDEEAISIISGEEAVDLYSIIKNSDFTFTETKSGSHLSEKNLSKINKLKFSIKGKNSNGENIEINIPLDVGRISK